MRKLLSKMCVLFCWKYFLWLKFWHSKLLVISKKKKVRFMCHSFLSFRILIISLHLQFSIFQRKVLYICMYKRNKLFILRWQSAYWNLVAVLPQYAFLSYQIRRVYVTLHLNLFKNNCIVFPVKMQTNNLKKWQTIDFDIEYSTNCI